MPSSSRPVFVLRLEARPGTDPIRALRAILKIAGRQFELKCVDAYEIPQPQPERTRAYDRRHPRHSGGARSSGRGDRSSREIDSGRQDH